MFLYFNESRFWRAKRGMVLIIVGILVVLSLNFFQKEVRGFFYFISSPMQKSFWQVGDKTSDFFEMITNVKNLKKENEDLKLKNQDFLAEIVSLRELRKENEILREALEIGLAKEFRLTMAGVIGKNINQDSLLINKGTKDGLSKGMPAITQQKVLLGKITEVYENFSQVLLISNKESSFDAKISNSDISGVVKGQGSLKLFLDLIPQDREVKEGDLVISTQFGGIYPKGLLIGLVKEAKKSDIKPFQQIEISPFFDFSILENVFVILNF